MLRYGLALMPAAAVDPGQQLRDQRDRRFHVGYGSNPAFPEITSSNSFGFNLPDLTAMRQLLWGEYRGLLFWSPVLLMAVPGMVVLFRKDRGCRADDRDRVRVDAAAGRQLLQLVRRQRRRARVTWRRRFRLSASRRPTASSDFRFRRRADAGVGR